VSQTSADLGVLAIRSAVTWFLRISAVGLMIGY